MANFYFPFFIFAMVGNYLLTAIARIGFAFSANHLLLYGVK
jgi:hypothetical protein